MSRYHRDKYTVSDEIYARLSKMLQHGQGRSRHADKIAGVDRQYIYSHNTYNTYMREAKHFREWLKSSHPEVKHLEQGRQYVNDYLQAQTDARKTDGTPMYSAFTISTRKAALGRLYSLSGADMIATPERRRADITRSRGPVDGDRHVSKAKRDYYAALGRATGLRRREMEHITGDALYRDPKGFWALHVTDGTKGGKPRNAVIYGTPQEIAAVVDLFRRAGRLRVAPKLPSHFDEHSHRAEYARGLYNALARPEQDIPPQDRYVCRKDRAGQVLDRRAMHVVAKCLGHNRIDVMAEHYLWT